MRPSLPLLLRLPVRRTTSRQSWNAFVESVTSRNPDDPSIFRSDRSNLREEAPTTTNQSAPNYRRFKPSTRFSIYKMSEIQRTVDESADYKLVFFAPVDSVARIKDAIFEVGGGVLGDGRYTRCSFQSYGTGQFRPEVGAVPGGDGALGVTKVEEQVRVEIHCHGKKITKAAVRALLHTHPLDVPAYEVYKTEFGFLPQHLIAQPTPEQRLSWRPRTEEEQVMASTVQDKISKQFEDAKLVAKHASTSPQPTRSEAGNAGLHDQARPGNTHGGPEKPLIIDDKLAALMDFLDKSAQGQGSKGH
ncbi:hypothetical protein TWF281_005134 [Arthrobotrys megalospora]